MTTNRKNKGAAETLDFQIDMTEEFYGRVNGASDTIATVSWSVTPPNGQVTPVSTGITSNTNTTATVFLTGGAKGFSYIVAAVIVTNGGRTYNPWFPLDIT